MNDLTGKYFVKNTINGEYSDFSSLFDGLRILKIDGFTAKGQAKNVYTASWEYDEEEDFAIVMQDDEDPVKIIRECTDLDITFIIKGSYATNTIDAQSQHLAFVDYMTNTDVWVKSAYQNNLEVHCVCLKEYKPTTEKYHRGIDSYVMGTITMHMMEEPTTVYLVNYTLNGVTTQYKAYGNETFVLPLLPDSGKQIIPTSVNVSMSESDITDDTYNYETNTIAISNVSDTITITAESAEIPDAYTPLMYILTRTRQNRNAFQIPYHPNSNSKFELDVTLYGDAYTVLYSKGSGINSNVSASNPGWDAWVRWTNANLTTIRCGVSQVSPANPNSTLFPNNQRFLYTIDRGKVKYMTKSGSYYTHTIAQGTWSWNGDFFLFNNSMTSTNYPARAILYGAKVSEYNVETEEYTTYLDYVPVKRNSDGVLGIYDVVNGVFNANNYVAYIKPCVTTTRTLTGCTQSLLSAANTGTGGNAVFGETWSSKFTASENYTFSGGTFKVMVNGEDKTSQLATYDSTTDSWTVTLVAHWKDTIEITATAVAS